MSSDLRSLGPTVSFEVRETMAVFVVQWLCCRAESPPSPHIADIPW